MPTPSPQPKKQRQTHTPTHELAAHAVDAALDKRARDVTVMDMRGVSGVADIFVVATGSGDLQIRAIFEGVEQRIRERCGEKPWHVEGRQRQAWVLLDYVDLVVHVFNEEKRSFYDLERLWGDAPAEMVPDEGSSEDVELLQTYTERKQGQPVSDSDDEAPSA